jgi:hypothetical protein
MVESAFFPEECSPHSRETKQRTAVSQSVRFVSLSFPFSTPATPRTLSPNGFRPSSRSPPNNKRLRTLSRTILAPFWTSCSSMRQVPRASFSMLFHQQGLARRKRQRRGSTLAAIFIAHVSCKASSHLGPCIHMYIHIAAPDPGSERTTPNERLLPAQEPLLAMETTKTDLFLLHNFPRRE